MADIDLTDAFKLAMRALASTPTIVTTLAEGERHGMAATAVTSLSMDPPSLVVCVNRTASMHRHLAAGQPFCVNILQSQHADLCMAFGGRVSPEERFGVGEWVAGEHDLPALADAAAAVFCRVSTMLDHGSHTVVIGDVDAVRLPTAPEGAPGSLLAPLIYGNGGFLTVTAD